MDAAATPRRTYRWPSIAVAIAFGLVFAYYVWDAVQNMLQLPTIYELSGLKASGIPWWLLIVVLVLPIALYAAAFVLGRRYGIAVRALLFFVALTVLACLTLSSVTLEAVLRSRL